ncbi:hypothetical protein GLYMA_02G231300v4 [Glycine max]|uniref:Uncharacterized protein n=2 Tax=Glycine subgen. Soja TaxID=1462606 RepID=K7KA95_SOYBN|nr:hypothetical protein JHK87_004994 [Glycine soja]KAG5064148.1 hypothetical protein JHK85_005331 [Glycine max]KAG5081096.1 hypothetical protein JHK86_005161 [Glycine max]KAH1061704.1 hypothetical protein GYH30_004944 [Glycine max]KRH72750.1 hypothetical protein GLYMA_02G231300v4 [Glycine max]
MHVLYMFFFFFCRAWLMEYGCRESMGESVKLRRDSTMILMMFIAITLLFSMKQNIKILMVMMMRRRRRIPT